MDFHKTLQNICIFLLFCTLSFSGAQAQNTPELWDEYLHFQENTFPQLNTVRANARFYGVIKAEDMEGTMRGRVNVLLDIFKNRIQERFTFSFSGKNIQTDEEANIVADAEIRIFPEDIYFALHDFDFFLEGDPESDAIQTSVLPFLQKWIRISLEDLGADADVFGFWQENMKKMTYEQMKAQVLQEEYLDKTQVAILKKFFESLEQGEIFILSKREILEEKVVYTMRLNKQGIVDFIQDIGDILGEEALTTQEVEEIESILRKISFMISTVINPQDPNTIKIRFSFRGVNLVPELSLISLRMFGSQEFNALVNIEEPQNAVFFDELLLSPDLSQDAFFDEEMELRQRETPKVQDSDHILGRQDAEIVLIEYADIECPFCKTFHSTVQSLVDDNDDNVAWVYRHFPLGVYPGSHEKAQASECVAKLGDEEDFWNFIDLLYENQDIGFTAEALMPLVEEFQIETSAFKNCLESEEMYEVVEDHVQNGIRDGVSGTPSSTLVNIKTGETYPLPGAMSEENVQFAIDELLSD